MADQTNPYVQMGMMGMMMPNKYTDPAFKDKPLGLQGYYGAPTDAMGNPIQSFTDAQTAHDAWNAAHPAPVPSTPGTTLNSGNPYGSMFGALAPNSPGGPATQAQYAYNLGLGGVNPGSAEGRAIAAGTQTSSQPNIPTNIGAGGGFGGTAGGAAGSGGGAPQTNPIDMRQAYLDALSRPQGGGRVVTPGATVPQAQPLGTPSVMDSFLSAHPGGGGQGAGNYSNTGFFDTLNKLRSA